LKETHCVHLCLKEVAMNAASAAKSLVTMHQTSRLQISLMGFHIQPKYLKLSVARGTEVA
jgi:hypothetical protein